MPEIKLPPSRTQMPMLLEHEKLMQQHLRDEHLPEAVMPAAAINQVLKGQKALVTGANFGIGKAIALSLARAGADVVVNYVSRPEAAEDVVQKIAARGGNAVAMRANVAREDDVQTMFQRMFQETQHSRSLPKPCGWAILYSNAWVSLRPVRGPFDQTKQ